MPLFHLAETPLEDKIVRDPEFQDGLSYGKPRPGHPEGAVRFHIVEVLKNVEEFYGDSPHRMYLRLISNIHDTFKYQVDRSRNRTGENHHGAYAKRFAERYIKDEKLLFVIQHHDEAFLSWKKGVHKDKWEKANERAFKLIGELVSRESVDLFMAFFRCDNFTGDKEPTSYDWFRKLIVEGGWREPTAQR